MALLSSACGSGEPKPAEPAAAPAAPAEQVAAEAPDAATTPRSTANVWRGDLDGMTARRLVRMLVVYNKTNYFLDKTQQRGATYDMGVEFEKWLNRANKDKARPIRVMFIPDQPGTPAHGPGGGTGRYCRGRPRDHARAAEGRRLRHALLRRRQRDRGHVVAGRGACDRRGALGQSVYVRRTSSYFASLEALNARLEAQGKPPVRIVLADENLEDEDILEMVNAGIVDTTVVDSYLATFWEQVFTNLKPHPELVLRADSQIAWAIRKDNPQLKATLDQFVAKNKIGTAMGNMILRRYLQNTQWARNATSAADMKRFNELSKYFKKYADAVRVRVVAAGGAGLPGIRTRPEHPQSGGRHRRHAGHADHREGP